MEGGRVGEEQRIAIFEVVGLLWNQEKPAIKACKFCILVDF